MFLQKYNFLRKLQQEYLSVGIFKTCKMFKSKKETNSFPKRYLRMSNKAWLSLSQIVG